MCHMQGEGCRDPTPQQTKALISFRTRTVGEALGVGYVADFEIVDLGGGAADITSVGRVDRNDGYSSD